MRRIFSQHGMAGALARLRDLTRGMDWPRGLRAAIALCLPLVLADLLHFEPLGWAALGGFEAIIVDAGGPYRSRLFRLALFSLGGGLGCTIGTLAGNHLVWALPITALFCFFWSYAGVLGQPVLSAGILVQVMYIVGLGYPEPSLRAASVRGFFLFGGGLLAIFISLVLWPFDPYRPARRAVGECYLALASFLAGITELRARDQVPPALWHRLANHHQRRLRRAIESAWQAIASVRAETRSETAQSSYLIVLVESADMLLARSVALAESSESISETNHDSMIQATRNSIRDISDQSADASTAQQDWERRSNMAFDQLLAAEEWVAALVTRRVATTADEASARRARLTALTQSLNGHLSTGKAEEHFLVSQLIEALLMMETAVEAAAALRLGEAALAMGATGSHVRRRLTRLRDGMHLADLRRHLRGDSLFFRHGLRVAIVCSLDVILLETLNLDHGYWLLMTSTIVLQPYVSGTMRRGLDRSVGTVLGGVFAAFLAIVLHSRLITAAALFPLATLCLAFFPVNYAAFAFFLTPVFVLAYLPFPGDWQLAAIRVGDTVTGAVIALAAMRLLFPSFERDRLPGYLLRSLEANREYLATLAESWRIGDYDARALAQARRATGLAHLATEESVDRLLAERWSAKGAGGEAALAVTTYLRRFAQTITTLAAITADAETRLAETDWRHSEQAAAWLTLVQQHLALIDSGFRQQGRPAHPYDIPAFKSEIVIGVSNAVPAEMAMVQRLIARLQRQTAVLERQLRNLRLQTELHST